MIFKTIDYKIYTKLVFNNYQFSEQVLLVLNLFQFLPRKFLPRKFLPQV
jgi:hypothetical protein